VERASVLILTPIENHVESIDSCVDLNDNVNMTKISRTWSTGTENYSRQVPRLGSETSLQRKVAGAVERGCGVSVVSVFI
jgi:hypothetical protein